MELGGIVAFDGAGLRLRLLPCCLPSWWFNRAAFMTYACVHVCMSVCVDVCKRACLHVWMLACVHECKSTCVHVCLSARLYVCMSACVHAYTYAHTCTFIPVSVQMLLDLILVLIVIPDFREWLLPLCSVGGRRGRFTLCLHLVDLFAFATLWLYWVQFCRHLQQTAAEATDSSSNNNNGDNSDNDCGIKTAYAKIFAFPFFLVYCFWRQQQQQPKGQQQQHLM